MAPKWAILDHFGGGVCSRVRPATSLPPNTRDGEHTIRGRLVYPKTPPKTPKTLHRKEVPPKTPILPPKTPPFCARKGGCPLLRHVSRAKRGHVSRNPRPSGRGPERSEGLSTDPKSQNLPTVDLPDQNSLKRPVLTNLGPRSGPNALAARRVILPQAAPQPAMPSPLGALYSRPLTRKPGMPSPLGV